jgi:uncharacterized membrane protein
VGITKCFKTIGVLWATLVVVLAGVAAWGILNGCINAFLSGKFVLADYTRYTSMIWNSGQGRLFQFGTDETYLYTHLSFSLALLGPLFRVWNHPFLLSLLQWLMLVSGGVLLWVSASRNEMPLPVKASLVFFFVGYPFTQGVMLSEFHTVGPYFLLMPWLYECCRRRREMTILPMALLLGLREDAFLVVAPILVFMAYRQGWRTGYLYAAMAVVYGVVAIFCIYPWINDLSIFSRRADYIAAPEVTHGAALRRLDGLWLTLLPLVALAPFKRVWRPALMLLGGLVPALLSAYANQQRLWATYAAPVMTVLPLVVMEAWRESQEKRLLSKRVWVAAVAAVVVTLGVHFMVRGYILNGAGQKRCYQQPSPIHQAAYRVVRCIPQDKAVLTDTDLCGMVGNRRRVWDWDAYIESRDRYDVVWTRLEDLPRKMEGRLMAELQDGSVGVRYLDDLFVVLERGYDTAANSEALDKVTRAPIWMVNALARAGRDVYAPCGPVRYWEGDASRAPVTLVYRKTRVLPPGRYCVRLFYRAAAPWKAKSGRWGVLSLHNSKEQGAVIMEKEFLPVENADWMLRTCEAEFVLSEQTEVELRVTGWDAKLWLSRLEFIPSVVSN